MHRLLVMCVTALALFACLPARADIFVLQTTVFVPTVPNVDGDSPQAFNFVNTFVPPNGPITLQMAAFVEGISPIYVYNPILM